MKIQILIIIIITFVSITSLVSAKNSLGFINNINATIDKIGEGTINHKVSDNYIIILSGQQINIYGNNFKIYKDNNIFYVVDYSKGKQKGIEYNGDIVILIKNGRAYLLPGFISIGQIPEELTISANKYYIGRIAYNASIYRVTNLKRFDPTKTDGYYTITLTSQKPLSNAIVKIELPENQHGIVVVDANGNVMNYWVQNESIVWVKIPLLVGSKTLRVYYGSPITFSNPYRVFPIFIDYKSDYTTYSQSQTCTNIVNPLTKSIVLNKCNYNTLIMFAGQSIYSSYKIVARFKITNKGDGVTLFFMKNRNPFDVYKSVASGNKLGLSPTQSVFSDGYAVEFDFKSGIGDLSGEHTALIRTNSGASYNHLQSSSYKLPINEWVNVNIIIDDNVKVIINDKYLIVNKTIQRLPYNWFGISTSRTVLYLDYMFLVPLYNVTITINGEELSKSYITMINSGGSQTVTIQMGDADSNPVQVLKTIKQLQQSNSLFVPIIPSISKNKVSINITTIYNTHITMVNISQTGNYQEPKVQMIKFKVTYNVNRNNYNNTFLTIQYLPQEKLFTIIVSNSNIQMTTINMNIFQGHTINKNNIKVTINIGTIYNTHITTVNISETMNYIIVKPDFNIFRTTYNINRNNYNDTFLTIQYIPQEKLFTITIASSPKQLINISNTIFNIFRTTYNINRNNYNGAFLTIQFIPQEKLLTITITSSPKQLINISNTIFNVFRTTYDINRNNYNNTYLTIQYLPQEKLFAITITSSPKQLINISNTIFDGFTINKNNERVNINIGTIYNTHITTVNVSETANMIVISPNFEYFKVTYLINRDNYGNSQLTIQFIPEEKLFEISVSDNEQTVSNVSPQFEFFNVTTSS